MRVALIHAVAVAVEPVNQAFERLWPDAERMNLLDDALSVDRAKDADLTRSINDRILGLAAYARRASADGILFTCSGFGPAISEAAAIADVPVLKPNEAMFEASLETGDRIGMLATFEPSVGLLENEFRVMAQAKGSAAELRSICIPEAMAALRAGDGQRHDTLLAEAAQQLAHCDAIMLAQFSTARAKAAVEAVTGRPVLTSPESAVAAMQSRLTR